MRLLGKDFPNPSKLGKNNKIDNSIYQIKESQESGIESPKDGNNQFEFNKNELKVKSSRENKNLEIKKKIGNKSNSDFKSTAKVKKNFRKNSYFYKKENGKKKADIDVDQLKKEQDEMMKQLMNFDNPQDQNSLTPSSDTSSEYQSSNEISNSEKSKKIFDKEDFGKNLNELELEKDELMRQLLIIPDQKKAEIKSPKIKRVEAQIKSDSKKEIFQLEQEKNNLLAGLMDLEPEQNQDQEDTIYSDDSDDEVQIQIIGDQEEVKDEEKEVNLLVKEKEDLMDGLFDFGEGDGDGKEDSVYSSSVSELRLDRERSEDRRGKKISNFFQEESNFFMSDDD